MKPNRALLKGLDPRLDKIKPTVARNIVNLYRDIQKLTDGELLRVYSEFCRAALPLMIQSQDCLAVMIECGLTPAHVQEPRVFETDLLDAVVAFHLREDVTLGEKNILLPYVFLSEQVWIRGFEK
jgi:hypothetical protein